MNWKLLILVLLCMTIFTETSQACLFGGRARRQARREARREARAERYEAGEGSLPVIRFLLRPRGACANGSCSL
jgi:hypothetical protein